LEVQLVGPLRRDCIVIRCFAVCSTFSGQLQSGVNAFFILWRYERKQLWFVRSWVRMWFGQREKDFLWKMEGMSSLVWEAFPEFIYVASQI
jgi:hypothetical protein